MSVIIDFFSLLTDTVINLCLFVVNTLKGLVALFMSLPQLQAFLVTAFAYLPEVLAPFATATIALFVIKFIVNR